MKRKIKIEASFTGVISTGAYENEKPFFAVSEEWDDEIGAITDEAIFSRQEILQRMCYQQFKRQEEIAITERIAKEYKNIRFYDCGNGVKIPSVTSIIGWDEDFFMPPEALAQYSARGEIIHKQVEVFLKTNKWENPDNLPEIYPALVTLKNGSLKLTVEDVNFPDFYEKYPFKVIDLEKTVINNEIRYAGRLDIKCIIESKNPGEWKKIADILFDVPTILDVKSGTIAKTKAFKQQTAYAKCEPDVKQLGLIHLNNETKQGYSKPIIENDLNKYWSLFLDDREKFKKRFGV
jgi:hypothetical protein